MGTWSAAILGNDTAFDVHASVLEAYDAGVEPAQLRRRIEEQFASSLRIAEDCRRRGYPGARSRLVPPP